jgi:hypothetical protein
MQLMGELLRAWQRAGVTCLVATHAADRLLPQADGSVHLEAGIVTAIGGRGVGLSEMPPADLPIGGRAASASGEAAR